MTSTKGVSPAANAYTQAAHAKRAIVVFAQHQTTLQKHRDSLEADLAKMDQTTVQSINVPGYPPKQSMK